MKDKYTWKPGDIKKIKKSKKKRIADNLKKAADFLRNKK